MRRRSLFTGLILAVLALPAQAAGDHHGPMGRRSISVQGVGTVSARPDMAVINAGVTAQATSAKTALADHNQIMAKLLAALQAFGLAERDVQSRQVNLRAVYPPRRNQQSAPAPTGFRATGQVRIRLREVDRLGDLLDQMTGAGVNNLSGLHFAVAEPEPLRDQARKLAIQDARRRARILAAEAGVELGPVLRIREGGAVAPVREFRAMAVSSGAGPTAPGELDIRVGVSVIFAIK